MSYALCPTLEDATALSVECADCGRSRWWRPQELYAFGVSPMTKIDEISLRMSCSACVAGGELGKSIVVSAAYKSKQVAARVEAHQLNIRLAQQAESRAKPALRRSGRR